MYRVLVVLALWVESALFPFPALTAMAAGPTVEITEWMVPWENTRPRDPWYGPQDKVWFVGQAGDYVATFDPKSGEFKRYDLEDGAGPHTVVVDEAGAWYAGNRVRHIGLIDPKTGNRKIFELPGDGYRDPHTMAFTREGNIWFTVQHGNQVGFLKRDTRKITLYDLESSSSRPYGLAVDSRDLPWFTLFGTNALGTLDPSTGRVKEIRLPRSESRPRRLAITPDGMVWYVDFAQGYLGRYNPGTGAVEEWPTPGGRASGPYAMGADALGRLWFVETGLKPNRFVGFDPKTETFTTAVPIESGGGVVRNMMFHKPTNSFWFGTDANTIGRARVR
ncbi:lyase [Desulfuromonas sp. TF]|uniref:Vgb family protein n=1 Tax=Desulfuromonas sp. TF TaxID=1232410 RepID=UPI000424EB72|nr:lyase [Desulfuromonas sp. TF]